jgi:quercetin dioxygenase-like cupin family protein
MEERAAKPVAVAPGDGISVESPLGGVLTFTSTSADSGGALTAIDAVNPPGAGPPLHVHEQDELIYTLEGTFRVKLGDELFHAPPGSFVFIPGGTPHTWQNVGDGPARFFAAVMPASTGFEEHFIGCAELAAEERGLEAFARIGRETGALEVLGPPLAQSAPL